MNNNPFGNIPIFGGGDPGFEIKPPKGGGNWPDLKDLIPKPPKDPRLDDLRPWLTPQPDIFDLIKNRPQK